MPMDMADYTIAILPGDGVGREVSVEAMKILEVIQNNSKFNFDMKVIPCGGQNYMETGEEWAEGSFEFCRDCLLYTSPSPRDLSTSRMPSSA